MPQSRALVHAGNDQHGNGVCVRLGHGCEDVGDPGPGDNKTYTRFTGDPGIPISHEACTLFMAWRYVSDARLRQPSVELNGVYAGDAENGVDAPCLELFDEEFAAGSHQHFLR
ncbi:hypothetical protein D3C80_1803340 [compost metagenome]